jgi:hypothetical protein
MRRKEDSYPTVYCRGTLKIVGNTDTDRACMESDNKRYWRYKILMAIATILMSLGILIKALYPFFK